MKIFAIFATALLATATHAAPDIIEARNLALIPVTFIGAAGESFTQYFPVDDSLHVISNHLSVSKIIVPIGYTCIFYGVDGSITVVVGGGQATPDISVGPPQTIAEGNCHPT